MSDVSAPAAPGAAAPSAPSSSSTPSTPSSAAPAASAAKTPQQQKTPAVTPAQAREAEYQQKMAEIRSQQKKSALPTNPQLEALEVGAGDVEGEGKEETAEEARERKIWKLKIDGKEEEFDATDEEAVKREVQKGRASQRRFEQAARVQKQAEAFIENLVRDPFSVLEHPQLANRIPDLRDRVEKWLYGKVQHDSMTPEQKQAMAEKRELEQYRTQRETEKAARERQRLDGLKEQKRQELTQQFTEAMDTGGLPVTDWTVQRMANYMKQARAKGMSHIKPTDVVDLVRNDWLAAQRQMFGRLEGTKLIEILGKDTADKIRRADLAALEGSRAPQQNRASAPASQRAPAEERRFASAEEMRDAAVARARRG